MNEASQTLPPLPPIEGSNISPSWLGMRRVPGRFAWMAPCGTVISGDAFCKCRTMLDVVEVLKAAGLGPPSRAYIDMVRQASQAEDLQVKWVRDDHEEEVAALKARATTAEEVFLDPARYPPPLPWSIRTSVADRVRAVIENPWSVAFQALVLVAVFAKVLFERFVG